MWYYFSISRFEDILPWYLKYGRARQYNVTLIWTWKIGNLNNQIKISINLVIHTVHTYLISKYIYQNQLHVKHLFCRIYVMSNSDKYLIHLRVSQSFYNFLKFIYSEKTTKFCKFFTLLLTVCTVVKSKGKISQNLVAFSEYMNFNIG